MQTLNAFFTVETAQKAGCVDRQGGKALTFLGSLFTLL
jgi:hypothetical protein